MDGNKATSLLNEIAYSSNYTFSGEDCRKIDVVIAEINRLQSELTRAREQFKSHLTHLYTARRNAITEQERKQIDELIQHVEGEV